MWLISNQRDCTGIPQRPQLGGTGERCLPCPNANDVTIQIGCHDRELGHRPQPFVKPLRGGAYLLCADGDNAFVFSYLCIQGRCLSHLHLTPIPEE